MEKKDLPILAKLRGPGPAGYSLPSVFGYNDHDISRRRKPAWSMGGREWNIPWKSPGPVITLALGNIGKENVRAYSIRGRINQIYKPQAPPPTTYSPENVNIHRRPPSYSMSFRSFKRIPISPAPNKYNLPPMMGVQPANKKSFPSFSITGRNEVGSYAQDFAQTPGPSRYAIPKLDAVYDSAPKFSLNKRPPLPRISGPGPGQHRPETVRVHKPAAPAYSMGVRHSDYMYLAM